MNLSPCSDNMDFDSIKEYLKPELDRVMTLMKSSLSSDIALLEMTNRKILSRSGKQVRPVIALLSAKACSGGFVSEDTIHYAAATELLHNASLLHDDVADNSSTRRGEPTVMSLLGGRAAVLLGDYWLVKGVDNILAGKTSSEKVIKIFSKTLSDLAEGEMLQLQKAECCDTLEQDYYKIIYNKTASLFVTSANAAAISVGASDEKRRSVKSYAECLGLAFQIRDDIFDYEDGISTGKPGGLDLMERKITLPLLGALANVSTDKAKEIRRKICQIDENPEYQKEIVAFVHSEAGMEYAFRRLGEYVEKAKISLRPLGYGRDVEMLADIADFVAYRKS